MKACVFDRILEDCEILSKDLNSYPDRDMPSWITTGKFGSGGFQRMLRREKWRESETERNSERERERTEILIQATVQGTISLPSTCLCFRRILDKSDIP